MKQFGGSVSDIKAEHPIISVRLADITKLLESPSLTGETFAILQREQTKLRRILKTRKEESCTIKPKR